MGWKKTTILIILAHCTSCIMGLKLMYVVNICTKLFPIPLRHVGVTAGVTDRTRHV